jgi:hypothetical protein
MGGLAACLVACSAGATGGAGDAAHEGAMGADASSPDAADANASCGAAALSTCLAPNREAAYYVSQAHAYFDALDKTAQAKRLPSQGSGARPLVGPAATGPRPA